MRKVGGWKIALLINFSNCSATDIPPGPGPWSSSLNLLSALSLNVSLWKSFSLGLVNVLSLGWNFLLKDSFVGHAPAVFLFGLPVGLFDFVSGVFFVVSTVFVLGRSSVSSKKTKSLTVLRFPPSFPSLNIDSFTAVLISVYSRLKSRSLILLEVSSRNITSGSPIVSKKSPLMIIFLGISFGTLFVSSMKSTSCLLVSPFGLYLIFDLYFLTLGSGVDGGV